jgi:hypothetical protein
MKNRIPSLAAACGLAAALGSSAAGQQDVWKQVRPSNTGIPGIQMHYGTWAPDGKLWVAGRWPFWGEGGLGIYDIQQNTWETISNTNTPLPSQWVNEVAFAADGSAWIATDGGLVHKTGTQYAVYTSSNAPFFHNQIDDVAIAPNGHIWVNNSGVNETNAAILEFDGTTWHRFRVGTEIPFATPWYQLSEVLVTPDGRVWVGNEVLNGIAEFNGVSWTLHDSAIGRVGSGLVTPAGDLWLLAGVGGGAQWWKYTPSTGQTQQFTPAMAGMVNTTVTRMAQDDAGGIYVGNWYGQVSRYDGSGWSLVADVGDAAYGIMPVPGTSGGELWVATLGNGQVANVHHVVGGASIARWNTYNTGMPDYFIDRFYLDPEGFLWMDSSEAGLSRWDGSRWRNYGNHNEDSEPYPFAGNEAPGQVYFDRSGMSMWQGNNGITRIDRATNAVTGFWNWQTNPGMGVTSFTSFAEDAEGVMFAADSYGATFRFDGVQWSQQATSAGSYTSTYAGVKADTQGRVYSMGWLRAWLWDGSAWSEIGQSWDIFGKGGITCYEFGPDGTLWIGTNEGLLRVQNPPLGPISFYTPQNSPLPAKQVQGIDFRASDGAMAVSAHEFRSTTPFPTGVSLIRGSIDNTANWRVYRYGQDPIPHYQLGPVKFDAQGNLWISAISEACAVLMNTGAPACYANCDQSTAAPVLNVLDFNCFLNRFSAGDPYANCDQSTTAPVLNVLDFNCFLNRFTAGCP